MPRLEFAVICHSAIETGGTLSMLGVGIDKLESNTFPAPTLLTYVFKIRWSEAELHQEHGLVVAIDPTEDGERLAELSLRTTPERRPEHPPLPLATQLILMLPATFPTPGTYTVVLNVDGEPLAIVPLIVSPARQ